MTIYVSKGKKPETVKMPTLTGKTLDDAQPVVETVPGWHCDITGVRKFEDLPKAAQDYVKRLEELVGCKIKYISVGPERDACIVRK